MFFFPFMFACSLFCLCLCYQSYFVFFNIVFESLYWCIHTLFNTRVSSSAFFSWHIVCLYHLYDVKPCESSSTFLFSDAFDWVLPLSSLRILPSILQVGLPSRLFLWWDFSLFYIHFRLFYGFRFQYSQIQMIFSFLTNV